MILRTELFFTFLVKIILPFFFVKTNNIVIFMLRWKKNLHSYFEKVLKELFSLILNKKMALQNNINNSTNISQVENEFLFVQILPGCIKHYAVVSLTVSDVFRH